MYNFIIDSWWNIIVSVTLERPIFFKPYKKINKEFCECQIPLIPVFKCSQSQKQISTRPTNP